MNLAVLQASVLQTNGALSVAAGAQITVRTPAGVLATLYEDRAGTTPTGANPVFADSKGFFRVYVAPGRYDVTVTTSSGTQVYEDIALFADGFTPGDASTANIGTATGEVIGTDEAREYFGLEYEPSVLPTISSDFERNKHELYEQYGNEPKTILQTWTTTRDTTGTYRDAAGVIRTAGPHEPRIDYDPVTGRGSLLAEELRTNLLTYSEQFNNSVWNKIRISITANAAIAPDGTTTADLMTGTGVSGLRYVEQVVETSANGKSQFIYAKAGTGRYLQIFYGSDSAPWANFDLQEGVVGSTGTVLSAEIEPASNGYWKCTVTTASTLVTHASFGMVSSLVAGRAESNTLDTGFYIWGAQQEAAPTPSSYIKTEASQVTRSADDVSRVLGGEFNTSEGVIYAFAKVPTGSPVVTLGSDVITSDSNDWKKYAITYSNSAATDIEFGVGEFKEFKYIPRALTEAELQEMTKP